MIPTKTHYPTYTPRSTKPTETKSPTAEPSSTLSSVELAARYGEAKGNAYSYNFVTTEQAILNDCSVPANRLSSPSGQWVAVTCIDHFTDVYNRTNNPTIWKLDYYKIFGLEYEDGNQFGSLYPLYWSADDRYLYLSPWPCCLDGGCIDYADGLALFRLDVKTGKLTQTLQPEGGLNSYDVSFSHDGRYLAYFRNWLDFPILNIQNLITGEEQHIPLGEQYSQAGEVVWSPDLSKIVLSARSGEECDQLTYYLVMVNLSDLSQTVLLEGADMDYFPEQWTKDNHIILSKGYHGVYYTYDLGSGELLLYPTLTPTMIP